MCNSINYLILPAAFRSRVVTSVNNSFISFCNRKQRIADIYISVGGDTEEDTESTKGLGTEPQSLNYIAKYVMSEHFTEGQLGTLHQYLRKNIINDKCLHISFDAW